MRCSEIRDGLLFETASYSAVLTRDRMPVVRVQREGHGVLDLRAVSGLAAVEQHEVLDRIDMQRVKRTEDNVTVVLTARSNLWKGRTFHWAFSEDGIEHEHRASGVCRPGRCFFFSNGGALGGPEASASAQVFGSTIHGFRSFSPAANLADEYERTLGIPLSLGILPEVETPFSYGVPDRTAMIFAPPPLCLAFGDSDRWSGLGIGTTPGNYLFNSLECRGGQFLVNYLGYQSFRGFRSPRAAIRFGYSPFEVLERYTRWMDDSGYTTSRRHTPPSWHRLPVFCGWGEQCLASKRVGGKAGDHALQSNYERWTGILEKRDIPFGTLVIDDKWQAAYGSFDVDRDKWPDMRKFVDRQHRKGRHVLLWIPAYHSEGLPDSLCVTNEDGKRYADVSNPAYERFLRRKIRHLVRDVGIDGFKVDWVWGITRRPGLKTHAHLHGIEWLRRFQTMVYDETHRWRHDAMVETHSANPLFRESSDVLRLNDLYPGARNISKAMAMRARIARIAGWSVFDCDAASDSIAEWWEYMNAQPSIGTPALYMIDSVRSAKSETVPKWMWESLGTLWRQYRREII